MENTLSDVEFGSSDSMGAIIIGGACMVAGAIGFVISKVMSGAKLDKALEDNREMKLAIAEIRRLLPTAAQTPAQAAPVPAQAQAVPAAA